MKTPRIVLVLICLAGLAAVSASGQAQLSATESQIAGALAAAPEDRREGAAVLGYDSEGELVSLRPGTNEILCLADTPGDERFHVACYHRSLDPFMARGRELKAQGMTSIDAMAKRHEEADAGKLELPDSPAALYVLGGPLEAFDPATGEVEGAKWIWSIYIPYATATDTGLPTSPQAPGAPWIMRPGTASSHIMVIQPRPDSAGSAKP